ncbi:MAG: TonB-dependent receptor plug domain-containing protein, partial [Opitutales bacterium]|nr:TonB-dependent receptor plug domain-containing protein [Opitutales bacterium]
MPSLSRLAGWSLVLGAGAVLCAVTRAQTTPAAPVGDPLPLGQFVVSASRTPQDPKFVASSVTTLALADLAAAQVTDLRTALSAQAGVGVVSSGAVGGQTSVFLRGSNSYQTLFIVDGVRMNDRAALYSNFLGGADLAGLGRIEVLRGPQSTLYGSSAMGGVIVLDTARG